MAARIYSLAKELKLDSKVLVEICPKAGVTGKGSALASLSDEEVAKVKAYLSGGATKEPQKATGARRDAKTAAAPTTFRREDYIAPGRATGSKPPVLAGRLETPPAEIPKKAGGEGGKTPVRTARSIKLAPMPAAPAAKDEPEKKEPTPQKPDIKLPADAIRAGKAGSKPLQAHLRKHEMRRKAEASGVTKMPAAGTKAPAAPRSPVTRERRRGGRGTPRVGTEGEFASALGGREQRQLKRKRTTTRHKSMVQEDGTPTRPTRRRIRRTGTNTAAPRKTKVTVELPCTVRSFSEAMGVPARVVLGKMMSMNQLATINAQIDAETAELLAIELGVDVDFRRQLALEEKVLTQFEEQQDDADQLETRPPVVTMLGHVDHGKTSLLDRIIGTDVVSGESGGITQHIRAYRVKKNGRVISFVDTPGHEAFTEMRARGANVTDIAVLVVAADDGVMPQTEEAINHARAANVPIVVALNKIDLPGINTERVYQQLAAAELLPTEWGGDTELVKTSATTGEGVDDLLDMLLTIAELQDYKANPNRAAQGACLESELHEERGVIAKLLVQRGTLKVGDCIVCGSAYGRIKAIYDTLQLQVTYEQAGPSMPINVTGFNSPPEAGEKFYVLDEITTAREIAERRAERSREDTLADVPPHVTLESLFDRLSEDEVQTLNLILRTDTLGSKEAILKELTKLDHPEVQIKVLQALAGGITVGDVVLADASDAVVVGFRVFPDEGARRQAERRGVQIRRYDVIYQLTDDLKAALEGMLKPEERETELGRAMVLQLFHISRMGTIAGCRVIGGTIERNARIRVIRDSRLVGDYPIESLRREKDDAREVRDGLECGIKLAGFNDIKEGDTLEAYKVEEVARTFD